MTQRIEDTLADFLEKTVGVRPTTEYKFHSQRDWRFDLAYPTLKLAIEIDGSRHVSQAQLRKDAEKLNAALQAGWRVLRFPASSVLTKSRQALIVEQIWQVMCGVNDEELSGRVLTGEVSSIRKAA